MLVGGLFVLAIVWALWLCFLIRYLLRWEHITNALHVRLGLSAPWLRKAETELTIKIIVGVTTMLTLIGLAILLTDRDVLNYAFRANG
jgi:hypothetical protein